MHNWKLRLLSQLTGAWRYRWYGLVATFVICAVGWFAVALIPNTFESEAKVYIDTDTLLRPLLQGLAVTTNADQQVNVMLRTLLSDTNVERVVRATDPNAPNLPLIAMRDEIASIQHRVTLRDLGTANLYSISFRDADPRHAQTVTQSLLSVLIDSNLGNQRHDTESAQSFLDAQIADYERKLSDADRKRSDFKAAHISFFSNGSDNAVDAGGGVSSATMQVSQAQQTLDEAVARRNSLRAQVSATQATLDVNAPDSAGFTGGGSGLYGQLALARTKLAELRTHYTEQYPDVIAQKNMVARLQADIASSPTGGANTQGIANPVYTALRSKLADEEANVALAQERLSAAEHRLQESKGGAVDALGIERQYQDLNRDYQVLHENYQQLVSRREAANISQAAGSQQSATFRVIDPPLKPDRPVAPNRTLINFVVLLLGIGAGVGVALGINLIQDRFMDVEKLTESFSIPIIGTVSECDSATDLAQNRRAVMLFGGGVAVLMLSYLVVLLIFHTQLAISQGTIL
jgi:polysaccharide chain length determinant protein (PEP-CTERM system associated)